MSDHAGLPSGSSLDQAITPIRPIAQHLHMFDVGDTSDLGYRVLQHARRRPCFAQNPGERGECLLIAESFLPVGQSSLSSAVATLANAPRLPTFPCGKRRAPPIPARAAGTR